MILIVFILIILIIYLLFNIKKNIKKEHFFDEKSSKNKNSDIKLSYKINDKINMSIYNIFSVNETFYEIEDSDNPQECAIDSDCPNQSRCIEKDGLSQCYVKRDMEALILEQRYKSYMEVENLENNYKLSFSVMLENEKLNQCVVRSKNNLWSICLKNRFFVLEGYKDNKSMIIKNMNSIPIKKYKIYNFNLDVNEKIVKCKLDDSEVSINLSSNTCGKDGCGNTGYCVDSENVCSYYRDNVIFGLSNKNIQSDINEYASIYIGNVRLDADANNQCFFDATHYKIKKNCIQECSTNNNCSDFVCKEKCKDVKVCSFKAIGRHESDCKQKCILNNDCNINYCNEECENCGSRCPWNDDSDEMFSEAHGDVLKGTPTPPLIKIDYISPNGNQALIKWKIPLSKNAPIKGYILYMYKTFEKSEGIRINKIDNECTSYTKNCEYLIEDLSANETYSINIKAYNSYGLGKSSNTITFKPDIKKINRNYDMEDKIKDMEVGSFNYCNA